MTPREAAEILVSLVIGSDREGYALLYSSRERSKGATPFEDSAEHHRRLTDALLAFGESLRPAAPERICDGFALDTRIDRQPDAIERDLCVCGAPRSEHRGQGSASAANLRPPPTRKRSPAGRDADGRPCLDAWTSGNGPDDKTYHCTLARGHGGDYHVCGHAAQWHVQCGDTWQPDLRFDAFACAHRRGHDGDHADEYRDAMWQNTPPGHPDRAARAWDTTRDLAAAVARVVAERDEWKNKAAYLERSRGETLADLRTAEANARAARESRDAEAERSNLLAGQRDTALRARDEARAYLDAERKRGSLPPFDWGGT